MTIASGKLPYQDTKIAQLLRDRIEALTTDKNYPVTQREIAAQMGYEKANVLSMYKRGEAKVPLDRVPAFAKALKVDTGYLLRLAFEQSWVDNPTAIEEVFGYVTTQNQREYIAFIQEVLDHDDPPLTPEIQDRLRKALSK